VCFRGFSFVQITSICFSPDGKTVAGGLIQGKVCFYDLVDFDQLKYKTQMDCRNRSGKFSKGTKVTGMCYRPQNTAYSTETEQETAAAAAAAASGGAVSMRWRRNVSNRNPALLNRPAELLVSTNDNRLRLCRLDDYSLKCKYRGLNNKSMQIKASFSSDGNSVICGSENGTVLIWNTQVPKRSALDAVVGRSSNRNDGVESFECTGDADVATTAALFAPAESLLVHLHNNLPILASLPPLPPPLPAAAAAAGSELDQQQHSKEGGGGGGATPARGHSRRSATASRGGGSTGGGGGGGNNPVTETFMRQVGADYCTRMVVTADYQGSLRVFVRLS
jgi:uncharacterized membrane protein YgcG